jgi:hypothetical protein
VRGAGGLNGPEEERRQCPAGTCEEVVSSATCFIVEPFPKEILSSRDRDQAP